MVIGALKFIGDKEKTVENILFGMRMFRNNEMIEMTKEKDVHY
jgi:hypothetical protein